jgi:hypothetical protein
MWEKETSFTPKFLSMLRTKKICFSQQGDYWCLIGTWGGRRKNLENCTTFHYPSYATTWPSNVGIWIIGALASIFCNAKKNNKKHLSDNLSWTMAKFMHQMVMMATKPTIQIQHYVVLNCDEVFTFDN